MQHRTERLLIREFAPEDATAVLAYHRDPRYQRFYPDGEHSEETARAFVQRFLDWQSEAPRTRFQWAAVLPGTGELVGNCGIRRDAADAHEADIGFELAPEHWGRGYATEMGRWLLRFGFETLGLHRVHAHCVAENESSARVLEKIGMRPEGRLRDKVRMRGRYWDVLLFGILEEEWRATPERGTNPPSAAARLLP